MLLALILLPNDFHVNETLNQKRQPLLEMPPNFK